MVNKCIGLLTYITVVLSDGSLEGEKLPLNQNSMVQMPDVACT